jgi:hypothetical protein
MSLVKVWTDVGGKKPVALLAKIVERDGVILTIKYLTAGKDNIWRYETDTYEIEEESIAEYLKTDDETSIGFVSAGDGFIQEDDDDYEPDEDEEEETDEEDEEDFEEDEEEFNEDDDEDDDEDDEDEEEYVDE